MNRFYPYYSYVYIDLAHVLQAHSEGMMRAFMMGQQMCVPVENSPVSTEASVGQYLGVFDNHAYGVYEDPQRYEESKSFWNSTSVQQKAFGTYEEALSFAQQGVAALNQLPVDSLPPMKRSVDWMQRIFPNGGTTL